MKTRFYTGKGDDGTSDLGGGKKVSKSSAYASFLGSLDELNSWLGLCRAESDIDFVSESLFDIQQTLFIAQAEVAAKGADRGTDKEVTSEKTKMLENIIEKIDGDVPKIDHFVIPGGSRESALLDVGRARAREVERFAVSLKDELNISDNILSFLNRLSSTLFALARYVNFERDIEEDSPAYE